MKISTEFKIGVIGLITVAVLIWGINYLKGKNILKGFDVYYTYFDEANGIEVASKIYMQGYQIGLVKEVNYKQFSPKPIEVILSVKSNYKVPKGSFAEMYSSNILGSQAIKIIPSDSENYCEDMDTLETRILPDMMASVQDDIGPVLDGLSGLVSTLDTLSLSLKEIVRNGDIERIVKHTEEVTSRLNAQLSTGGDLAMTLDNLERISADIRKETATINKTIANLEKITGAVDPQSVDSIVSSLASITPKIDQLLGSVNNGEGTVGQLVKNDSLYNELESLTVSLNKLMDDIREHPKKYVHFSVFERKDK